MTIAQDEGGAGEASVYMRTPSSASPVFECLHHQEPLPVCPGSRRVGVEGRSGGQAGV